MEKKKIQNKSCVGKRLRSQHMKYFLFSYATDDDDDDEDGGAI